MAPHVAVIGAGVSGLSTAVLAQEKIPGLHVTIISEQFSPHTTGDVSAGLWFPHCLQDTPPSDICRWSNKTYNHMLSLWQSADADDAGVCLIPKFELSEKSRPDEVFWSKIPIAYDIMDKEQTQKLIANDKYQSGVQFMTFTLEPSRYLPYLTNKFLLNGGRMQQRKVENLHGLFGQYDAVINCSGVHARHLVEDHEVAPIRGQVIRVKAPWFFISYGEQTEDGSYLIPNTNDVILGGTHQQHDWNTDSDPKDAQMILDKCYRLIPGLKTAQMVSDRAGLRPGRTSVRIEREQITDGHGNKLEVIHNYGHGGSGVTLSWGCAHDVVDILQSILKSQKTSKKLQSKL